jgi:autotransporter-associated beta strand protein
VDFAQGTFTFVKATSEGRTAQSGGELAGTGTLTVKGSFEWTGGTQIEAGTTEIASEATLAIKGATHLASKRKLLIKPGGTGTLFTGASLSLVSESLLENAGTFNADGNAERQKESSTSGVAPATSETSAPGPSTAAALARSRSRSRSTTKASSTSRRASW